MLGRAKTGKEAANLQIYTKKLSEKNGTKAVTVEQKGLKWTIWVLTCTPEVIICIFKVLICIL